MLSVSTSGKSRFQGKLDKIFWFIIMILPLVFWLVLNMVPVAVSAETENTEESATVSTVAEEDYTYKIYFNYSFNLYSPKLLPEGLTNGWCFFASRGGVSSEFFSVFNSVDGTIYNGDDSYNVLSLSLHDSDSSAYYYRTTSDNLLIIEVSESFIQSLGVDFGSDLFVYYTFSSFWLVGGSYELVSTGSFSSLIERVPVEIKSDSFSLESVLVDYFGIDMISENSGGIIGDTLYGVFGSTGIFPIFTRDSAMIYYMIYFVYVEILHVLIDILVFIPRFAHKILGKAINFGD